MEPYRQEIPPPDRRAPRVWPWRLATIVCLIAAVAAGSFALWASLARAHAEDDAAAAHRQVATARSEAADSQRQLAATPATDPSEPSQAPAPLQPPGPDPSTVLPSGAGVATAVGIFRQGTVTVAAGKRIDVDAVPNDPQWGTLRNSDSDIDLTWIGDCGGLCVANQYQQLQRLVVGPDADQATCATTTGYTTGNIPVANVRTGLTLCVVTTGGRFAVVRVVAVGLPSAPIKLNVTTYAKDGD